MIALGGSLDAEKAAKDDTVEAERIAAIRPAWQRTRPWAHEVMRTAL